MKRVFVSLLLIAMALGTKAKAEVIDDFEDGVINTDLWCTVQGALYGGYEEQGWGEVYETGGQLVLTSYDQYTPEAPHGAGVAVSVLRQMYLDVPIKFSFEASIYDSDPGPSYSPHIEFMIIDQNNIDNWAGQGYTNKIVYAIEHDQQNLTTEASGSYYYYFDSLLKEARLYDASNSALLGSISYADFTGGPYICFEAYTDTNGGYISETIKINEITVVPEPAAVGLMLLGGLGIWRKRKG